MQRNTKRGGFFNGAPRPIQGMAACLVLLLVLMAGCGPVRHTLPAPKHTPSLTFCPVPTSIPSAAPASTPSIAPGPVAFSAMDYERPDFEKISARFLEISREISTTVSLAPLARLSDEIEALTDHISTMAGLAGIHAAMDETDATWAQELAFCMAGIPAAERRRADAQAALYRHPLRPLLEVQKGRLFSAAAVLVTEQNQALWEEEARLLAEYNQMLLTVTVNVNGTPLTYSGITGLDGANWWAAMTAWQTQHGPALGEIYLQLIALRQKIAQSLQFEHYAELALSVQNAAYTMEDMEGLLHEIQTALAPLYRAWPQTETPAAIPEPIEAASALLEALDPALLADFREMLSLGLCDYTARPNKQRGAFTTYLPTYGAPFLFCTLDGGQRGLSSLLHEFGHYDDFLKNGLTPALEPAFGETLSQGMELLCAGTYSRYFDASEAARLTQAALWDALYTLVSQAYFTAMELSFYSLDDDTLSVDALMAIAKREAERFGLAGDAKTATYFAGAYVAAAPLYANPFYSFCYLPGMDIALQLWAREKEAPGSGAAAYRALLSRRENSLTAAAIAAGLKSPFDPGAGERQRAILSMRP